MTYNIYEEYLPMVEKKLNRIKKQCQKYGNDFVYEIIGSTIKEIKDEFGQKRYYKFFEINVEGTAKIADWECVAVLEIYDCGNVIRKINTDMEVPERFKTTKNICEHCNSNRFRNNLYVIHNVVTDEWKQVGKSCLRLYTNGLNAEFVASYMNGIIQLEENNNYIGVHGTPLYDIREVLGYAVEFIDKIGYFNAQSSLPTKHLVNLMLFDSASLDARIARINKLLEDYNHYFKKRDFYKESTDEKVNQIIEYYKNLNDDSEFMHNIHVMIKNGFATQKSFGYLCYLPEGYNRYIQQEEKKRQKLAEEIHEHYGEIGKRYRNLKVREIKTISSFETVYGISYFCKITLDDGHVVYWSGNGVQTMIDNGKTYVPCVPDMISFTVKEHGEYKGVPQTKVTRCNIEYRTV